jgi:8-oxo-dGTP pyrophosphatase MutT (NUDIX family)
MQYLKCKKGCCSLEIHPYIQNSTYKIKNSFRKAGVFIYDPNKNKVLLVQSKGNLWGIPKGSLKYEETERICAVREVKEETGLTIYEDNFSKAMVIRNRAVYYYMEKDECLVKVQNHIPNNDANAIGWIRIECLEEFIIDGHITLTQHCRLVFKRFMNKEFPHSTFVLVKNKRKS